MLLEAIILGVVQGLTEFLPVSSTAHLVLLPEVLGWSGILNSIAFDVALHFGTTAALLWYFRKDWMDILLNRHRLFLLILLGSVPVGIVGLGFRDVISNHLRRMDVIAAMLVVFGVVMLLSERVRTRKGLADLGLGDALIIGLAQVLALIPGVSRSGITISAGLFSGVHRADAARFSFLLSTPAILGATLLEGRAILGGMNGDLVLFAAGFASSLVAGLAALAFLMTYLKEHPVSVFVYYRFALAAGIILAICLRA